jgi:hypothetical protein
MCTPPRKKEAVRYTNPCKQVLHDQNIPGPGPQKDAEQTSDACSCQSPQLLQTNNTHLPTSHK